MLDLLHRRLDLGVTLVPAMLVLVLSAGACSGSSAPPGGSAPAASGAAGASGSQSAGGQGGGAGVDSQGGAPSAGQAGQGGAAGMVATPSVLDPRQRTRLSETGLYVDLPGQTVSADVIEYEPRYALWSDGAEKRRWLRLPAGTRVDDADIDHWRFPVGTQLWKEFKVDGKRIETRLIERFGPGTMDYWMGAFVWQDDEQDALLAVDGAKNARGTSHDVPEAKVCWSCHVGEAGRVLGFSAMQLPPTTLVAMVERGILTSASPVSPPGDEVALGYLHGNCGHCHSKTGIAWTNTNLVLRLAASDAAAPASAPLLTSSIGVKTQSLKPGLGGPSLRIKAGSPDESAVVFRMAHRGDDAQMPPLATEQIDPEGLSVVRDWITHLPTSP